MTTDPGATTMPPPPPPANPMRRFRRSRTDRVLTGVCGGLGEATGVDPVVYRVLIAVLAFFGGAGLLVYAACWLLMPESDKDTSLAEEAIASAKASSKGGGAKGDGAGRKARVVLAVVLTLAALMALGAMSHNDAGPFLAVLFAGAVYLLIRRRDDAPAPYAPPSAATAAPAWDLTKPDAAEPDAKPSTATSPAPTPPAAPPPYLPAAPRVPRERSILGRLTVGCVLIAAGVLAAIDQDRDVPLSAYPAVVLAVTGAGLLVGTSFGRARGLIALGVLATLALPCAAVADVVDGEWTGHDRRVAPADVAAIAPEYEFGAGRIDLDLGAVDFSGADVTTSVDLGAGELIVTVPRDVDVHAEVDLGVGDAEILGADDGGLGVEKDVTDNGPDGVGGGRLHLVVDQGLGKVEVRRAAS